MISSAIGTTTGTPAGSGSPARLEQLLAFALAGMAVFGVVLEESDAPHDNLQGFVVVGAGAVAGLLTGAVLGMRPALRASSTRIAWDAVRFVLAYEMIRYGIPKLIGMQFYPQYFRWDQRVIDQSPMGLAWEFLGRSYWYQAFGGLLEVAGGVLLCFRRTTLLGACLLSTALVNVVLINYFYGVPVKLFATLYLVFDVALIAPHARRLLDLFLAPVKRVGAGDRRPWLYGIVGALAIVAPTVKMLREGFEHRVFAREALEGAWKVDDGNGAAATWDRVYFEKDDVGFLRIGGKLVPFHKRLDRDRLAISVAADGSLSHDGYTLRHVADAAADAFPHAVEGTLVAEGAAERFDATCDGRPCTMRFTREFPR